MFTLMGVPERQDVGSCACAVMQRPCPEVGSRGVICTSYSKEAACRLNLGRGKRPHCPGGEARSWLRVKGCPGTTGGMPGG